MKYFYARLFIKEKLFEPDICDTCEYPKTPMGCDKILYVANSFIPLKLLKNLMCKA